MLDPTSKLALFMEDAIVGPSGKMGFGVLRYSPNPIVCVIDSTKAGRDLVELTGIDRRCPIVPDIPEAVRSGAEVLVLGIAPSGGLIPGDWWPELDRAVEAGLSIVNGLHDLVAPRYPHLSRTPGHAQYIWDVRIEPENLVNGRGLAAQLPCKRVLMIGSDMSVGKMTAGLEIQRAATAAGIRASFVATGQIGITVTGAGIPLDAIRVDFASGAVEREVIRCANEGAEMVIVEGQGSLVHPSSTANLPLIRGACPTHFILCHKAGLTHLKYLETFEIPPLDQVVALFEAVGEACGMFARPKTVAMALNTSQLSTMEADLECARYEKELGIPCVDPIRHGASRLLSAIQAG